MGAIPMGMRESPGQLSESSIVRGSSARSLGRSVTCRARARERSSIARSTSNKISRRPCLRDCDDISLLHAFKCLGDFIYSGHDRDVVVLVPCHFAVAVDDGDSSSCDALVCEKNTVLAGHGASWLKICQQGIWNAHLFRVSFVRPDAVYA